MRNPMKCSPANDNVIVCTVKIPFNINFENPTISGLKCCLVLFSLYYRISFMFIVLHRRVAYNKCSNMRNPMNLDCTNANIILKSFNTAHLKGFLNL